MGIGPWRYVTIIFIPPCIGLNIVKKCSHMQDLNDANEQAYFIINLNNRLRSIELSRVNHDEMW